MANKFDKKALEKLGQTFDNFEPAEDILDMVADWGNKLLKEMRNNLTKNKSFASSKLYQSLNVVPKQEGTRYNIKVEMEDYWKYVEYGRGPGKQPPMQSIFDWINVKRDVLAKVKNAKNKLSAKRSLAFVIARKIGREGIKPKPFVEPALQKVTVDSLIKKIEKYVTVSLGK